jgi:hypothetical protein
MQTTIQRSLGGVNRKSEIYFHHFPAHLDYGVEEMDFWPAVFTSLNYNDLLFALPR